MKFGGERKRSTYDWSSQGGKLPRCVLPRTGGATAVTRAARQAPVKKAHKEAIYTKGGVGRQRKLAV